MLHLLFTPAHFGWMIRKQMIRTIRMARKVAMVLALSKSLGFYSFVQQQAGKRCVFAESLLGIFLSQEKESGVISDTLKV